LSGSTKPKIVELNVLKRGGSVQPFEKNKLVASITKAGASRKQALLVSDRVVNRLGGFKQPVPTSQLSSMAARSLSRVNPAASGQYIAYRDQKLHGTQMPAAKGATFALSGRGSFKVAKPLIGQMSPQKVEQVRAVMRSATTEKITPITPPLQQKPAIIRLGESTPTIPLPKEIVLMRQQSASGSPTIPAGVLAALMPTQPKLVGVFLDQGPILRAHAVNVLDLPSVFVSGSEIEVYVSPTAISNTILGVYAQVMKQVGVNSDGSPDYRGVCYTGLVTYKYYYFSPDGTWPVDFISEEMMQGGGCYNLFQLGGLGVFEFQITLPGNEEVPPLTSNIVRITVKLAPG